MKIFKTRFFRKIVKQFLTDSIPISLIILLIGLGLVAVLYLKFPGLRDGYFEGIYVEFTGMMFDIIVFGLLIALYTRFTNKHNQIKQQEEILDDYKKWNSEEGKLRIAGAIRRINRIGKSNIDFSGIVLEKFSFFDADIHDISGSRFVPKLEDDHFIDFKMLKLVTRLSSVSFQTLDCQDVVFSEGKGGYHYNNLHFARANLSNAIFDGAVLSWQDQSAQELSTQELLYGPFEKANLQNTSFRNVTFDNADFRGARNILTADFTDAKGLQNCTFDEGVLQQILSKKTPREDANNHAKNDTKPTIYSKVQRFLGSIFAIALLLVFVESSLYWMRNFEGVALGYAPFFALLSVLSFVLLSCTLLIVVRSFAIPGKILRKALSVQNAIKITSSASEPRLSGETLSYAAYFIVCIVTLIAMSELHTFFTQFQHLLLGIAAILATSLLTRSNDWREYLKSILVLMLISSILLTWVYAGHGWVYSGTNVTMLLIVSLSRLQEYRKNRPLQILSYSDKRLLFAAFRRMSERIHLSVNPKGVDTDTVAMVLALVLLGLMGKDILSNLTNSHFQQLGFMFKELNGLELFSHENAAYIALFLYGVFSSLKFSEVLAGLLLKQQNGSIQADRLLSACLWFICTMTAIVFSAFMVTLLFVLGQAFLDHHFALLIGFFTFPVWLTRLYAYICSTVLLAKLTFSIS